MDRESFANTSKTGEYSMDSEMGPCMACRQHNATEVVPSPYAPVSYGLCEGCIQRSAHPYRHLVWTILRRGGSLEALPPTSGVRTFIAPTLLASGKTIDDLQADLEAMKADPKIQSMLMHRQRLAAEAENEYLSGEE